MNAEYPTTTGRWHFKINHLVVQASTVVTQGGKIIHLLEYWPAPYDAPDNRRHLTEPIA